MEARNGAFQQLKPVCVRLSESALKLMGKNGNLKDVTDNLQQLLRILRAVSTHKDALDNKLADYVFFPLSSVLRQLEKISLQARELTFECILILLRTAWAKNIAPELGMQLLILYSFISDQKGSETTEELQTTVFDSMSLVFSSLAAQEKGRKALLHAKAVPHIGKAVSDLLDAAVDGPAENVRLSAITALNACCRAIADREALAVSFLPGVMSRLTKVLTPQASSRTTSKVLTAALEVLNYLIPYLFQDGFTSTLPDGESDDKNSKQLSQKWLRATAPQIKMSLANIVKLQQHDRQVVRLALFRLCSELLTTCSQSLVDCVSILLEASLTIASNDSSAEADLRHLLATHAAFADTLRSSLHYWILSLARIMESADETKKQRRIHQITLAYKMLNELDLDLSIIHKDLANNLRDSVAGAIKLPKGIVPVAAFDVAPASLDLVRVGNSSLSTTFEPIIATRKSQMDTMKDLSLLTGQLGLDNSSLATAQDLAASLHNTTGDLQLAGFWLALNMVRSSLQSERNVDSFLTFSDEIIGVNEDVLEQLYDFSISTLSDMSMATEVDWRLQALSLEVLALQATQQKEDFRGELVDALYPVLHLLGSSTPALQSHAITCLNIIAEKCGYKSSGDLIVGNVDYLVNAVALRLNTFDISPQAPQVLLMMVKLAGPTLLPYLDDTVDSIFVALESFHGYPKLVDLLFSVLKVIAEEGAKASQLAITSGEEVERHKKKPQQGTSLETLVALLKDVRDRYKAKSSEHVDEQQETFPEEPWGKPKDEAEESQEISAESEDKPPAARTYSLLLNISKLTQHYLTSSSPELRTSLLDLLSASFPALSKHENSFLPLIHTLWPVLVPRLEDPEPYVVAGSLNIISVMCRYAGDFMTSRIDEIWHQIMKLYRSRTGRAGNPRQRMQRTPISQSQGITSIIKAGKQEVTPQSGPHYVDAPSRIIWNALVEMLISLVTYTSTNDMVFDDLVEVLTPVITSRPEVREALQLRNTDAVWLAMLRAERNDFQAQGVLEEGEGSRVGVSRPSFSPMSPPSATQYRFAPLR